LHPAALLARLRATPGCVAAFTNRGRSPLAAKKSAPRSAALPTQPAHQGQPIAAACTASRASPYVCARSGIVLWTRRGGGSKSPLARDCATTRTSRDQFQHGKFVRIVPGERDGGGRTRKFIENSLTTLVAQRHFSCIAVGDTRPTITPTRFVPCLTAASAEASRVPPGRRTGTAADLKQNSHRREHRVRASVGTFSPGGQSSLQGGLGYPLRLSQGPRKISLCPEEKL